MYPAMQLSVCLIVLDLICCLRDLLHVVVEITDSQLLACSNMRVSDMAMLALQILCAIKAIADGLRHVNGLALPTLPVSTLLFCTSQKGCDTQTLPKEQPQLSVKGYIQRSMATSASEQLTESVDKAASIVREQMECSR